jgi:hypothetical protein
MSERDCARRPSTEANMPSRFPDDFSAEEAAFASELRELFPIEQEVLPPLFAQTLAEDEWRSPITSGFEQKLAYRVFRRLCLPRRPLFDDPSRFAFWHVSKARVRSMSRPMVGAAVAMVMVMVFSIFVASPSFAAGLNLLLGHTGVVQVHQYPRNAAVQPAPHLSRDLSDQAKPQIPTDLPIAWLGQKADAYVYLGIRALDAATWSKGPIVDLQYVIPGQTNGSGVLDIREFRLSDEYAAVLQVVQDGAARLVQVGNNRAVYVNGIWRQPPPHVPREMEGMNSTPYWQLGVRSELIMERNGTIIWISADQRDGATADQLMRLGRTLQLANAGNLRLHLPGGSPAAGRALDTLFAPLTGPGGFELYELVRKGQTVGSGVNAFVVSGVAQ